jgi:hypothetical protein
MPRSPVWIRISRPRQVREGSYFPEWLLTHHQPRPAGRGHGHREILGLDVSSAEDGAGWLAFLRGLVARGLSGVSWSLATPTPTW